MNPDRPSAALQQHHIVRIVVVAALLALVTTLGLQPEVQQFVASATLALFASDPAVTRAWVTQFGSWGPLVLLAGFVLQAVLAFIPAVLLVLVALLAYGPVAGFLIVYAGTLLGAAAGYALGFRVGDPLIRMMAGTKGRAKAHAFAGQHGVRGVVLVRLMPVLSSDLLSLVAGATRLPFGRFMLATSAGALPVTLLMAWLVHSSSGSPGHLARGLGLLSVVVGAAALIPWLLRRWRGRV